MTTKSSNTASEGWYAHSERTSQTDDQRIKDVMPLPPPEHLIRFFPIAGTPVETLIGDTRNAIRRIMQRKDDRLLVIMGPCSIHDPVAAVEYARKLKAQRDKYADTLEIVMRVYFEKPRTTVGWKGLINDPYLDETYRIDEGLRIGRQLLLEINRLGIRKAKWSSVDVDFSKGRASTLIPLPAEGHAVFFLECEFDMDGLKYDLSTQVRIVGKSAKKE